MNCTFCVRVNMRRPFDSYLWFDHKNNQRHSNDMLNAISEKGRLVKVNKDGKKLPATNYIYLVPLGVSK